MVFVGADLAWGERADTGLCAIAGGRVLDSARRRSLDDIVRLTAGSTLDNLADEASGN
jgi:predicted RNase H-like nuclease